MICYIHFDSDSVGFLTVILLFSQIAATFVISPVGGFMAKTVKEEEKGRVGGWYQADNLRGMVLGGGADIWLSIHFYYQAAAIILSISM